MKRTIILGSLVAVFLLVMIPNVGAVEYQSVQTAVEEDVNITFTEKMKDLLLLEGESGFFKKIITIFLFIIDAVLLAGYYYFSPLITMEFADFLSGISDEQPLLAMFLAVLLSFAIPLIALQPTRFVFKIISKIQAWSDETLQSVDTILMVVIGLIFAILEKLGIIDHFPDPEPNISL